MNTTRSANKKKPVREISEEHWLMSFEKYFRDGAYCGYCRDSAQHNRDNNKPVISCNNCLIDRKVCGSKGGQGYYAKMVRAETDKTKLKYKNLIRAYILTEGRRLHYITPELEKVVGEITK